jgi:hypothetical protein
MKFLSVCNKIYWILILLSFINEVKAQKVSITWDASPSSKHDYYESVKLSNGQIIAKKLNQKYNLNLILLDANAEIIAENKMETEKQTYFRSGEFKQFGANVFYIYQTYNRDKTDNLNCFALKIDQKNLSVVSKIDLGTFTVNFSENHENASTFVKYRVSPDSSKILLFCESPKSDKENKQISLKVFNTDLKQLWSKPFYMLGSNDYIQILEYDLNNQGEVYVSSKKFDEAISEKVKNEKQEKVSSYTYKLGLYNKEGLKDITINIEGKYIHNTFLYQKSDGSVIISGLYKQNCNGGIMGIFYSALDKKTMEVKDIKTFNFTEKNITEANINAFAYKKNKLSDLGMSPYYKIQQLIFRKNGSVSYIMEYHYSSIVDQYVAGNAFSNASFGTAAKNELSDIIVINVANDGKVIYTRIPKNHGSGIGQDYKDFYAIPMDDKLVIIYDDNEENLEKSVSEKSVSKRFDKSVLVAATISNTGILTREIIYKDEESGSFTLAKPSMTQKLAENKFEIKGNMFKGISLERNRYGILIIK